MQPRLIKIIIFTAIFVWFGTFLAQKIDLSTADLGRHIQNGNVIVNGSWADKWAVLHTNFYSYTLTNQPFVNHHWLSGVVFYFINLVFGFTGLSVFYVLLGLLTLWLFFDVARKASNFWIAGAITIIVTPLISSRAEVRPEMFTYFFTGVFFWLLWNWRNQPLPQSLSKSWRGKSIWILPLAMLFWINLHIGFVFGFLVLAAFGLEQIIRDLRFKIKDKTKPYFGKTFMDLVYISLACVAAGFINPSFVKGFLYPLSIFKNYGYLIVENQSIKFLENIQFTQGQHFLLFKIVVGAALTLFILAAVRQWRRIDIAMLILTSVTAVMAYLGIRNFPSFAFFAIPVLAGNIYLMWPKNIHLAYKSTLFFIAIVIVGFSLFNQYQTFLQIKPKLGFGLLPEENGSVEFFKQNGIKGTVFNNYDNGSFLIYNLYPQKVFVDNRPEAYTPDFFQNVYEAAQTNPAKWQELDRQYDFNVIYFAYHDYTPWAQVFLISKVNDRLWAPVYVDNYNLIFLKRNPQNADIIKKYELPKSMFGVVTQ